MKSSVCAIMLAVEAFQKTKPDFNGTVLYTFVSDEEGPNGLGTNYLIEDNMCQNVDVAIVPEPSAGFTGIDFPYVCLGARGGFRYDIIFNGKAAHAATPEAGISAMREASKLITELSNVELIEDEELGKGSICITEITGGGQACSVADIAKITVFRHMVNSEDKNTMIKEIDDSAQRAGVQCDYEVKFRKGPTRGPDGYMPYSVDEKEYYTKSFLETVKKTVNNKASIAYFSSIGDFNYLATRLDAPTMIFGPNGKNFYSADEYVNVDDVVETEK